jgi:hypothetical protein
MQPKELKNINIVKRPVGQPRKIPENIKSSSTALDIILNCQYSMI